MRKNLKEIRIIGDAWYRIRYIWIISLYKVKYVESSQHYYLVKRTWVWLLFMPIMAVFMFLYIAFGCIVIMGNINVIKDYLFTDLDSDSVYKRSKDVKVFIDKKFPSFSDNYRYIAFVNTLYKK